MFTGNLSDTMRVRLPPGPLICTDPNSAKSSDFVFLAPLNYAKAEHTVFSFCAL